LFHINICAILPGKAVPEMTYMYIVSGGTLNHTHSLTVKYPVAFLAPFVSKIHNAWHFLGTPVTAEHLVGKTVNGIDGSSSRPSIGRSVVAKRLV